MPAAAKRVAGRGQSVEALAGDPLEPLEEAVERVHARLDLAEPLLAEVDRAAVVGREEEEADRLAGELLEHLAERRRALRLADLADLLGGQIAFGGLGVAAAHLAHLAAGLHQAVVQPILGHRLAVAALALGDFVFVVREDQVQPAAVDVERLAQQLAAHGGAFDVPAGPAGSPRAGPGRLAGLGRFPEGEIGARPLALGHAAALAAHGLDAAMAQLAVVRALGDLEIHVALRLVGEALFDQRLG